MKLHIIAAILLLSGVCLLHAQPKVSVDPASVTGPIKLMNAANNGPALVEISRANGHDVDL